jgi:hypothetical protein
MIGLLGSVRVNGVEPLFDNCYYPNILKSPEPFAGLLPWIISSLLLHLQYRFSGCLTLHSKT